MDPEFPIEDPEFLQWMAQTIRRANTYVGPRKPPIVVPALGYRVMTIVSSSQGKRFLYEFSVYQGVIELHASPDQVRLLTDQDRELERALLDRAVQRGAINAKLHTEILEDW